MGNPTLIYVLRYLARLDLATLATVDHIIGDDGVAYEYADRIVGILRVTSP